MTSSHAGRELFPPVVHPLVRTHPETGRDVLFLGGDFMCGIEGMHADERVVARLAAPPPREPQLPRPLGWNPADLVIWDEQEHQPPGAVGPLPAGRRMRRCTVDGDRPFLRA